MFRYWRKNHGRDKFWDALQDVDHETLSHYLQEHHDEAALQRFTCSGPSVSSRAHHCRTKPAAVLQLAAAHHC
jgi:hypothetical protein